MNINLQSLNNIQTLKAEYNHIAFWSLAQKYKKEMKEAGKITKYLHRGTVLRQRLRNTSWFNGFLDGQKTTTCDAFNIALLPNASESLRGIQHPDEKRGDRCSTENYWDRLIVPYDISHEIHQEEDLKGLDGQVSDKYEEISSDDESEGENNEDE
ncbi:hypothetical protein O181_101522 [Austropuccinia psidii MF-1]|uniref:Uncharacterized protein n=1 Tax=Austropuccinia psidii MF-1 TaxID=1389203 RepID=A0A9Q3JG54_9BASI|nr:hypothetical protein [Austropuccinia psidii MF-1]